MAVDESDHVYIAAAAAAGGGGGTNNSRIRISSLSAALTAAQKPSLHFPSGYVSYA